MLPEHKARMERAFIQLWPEYTPFPFDHLAADLCNQHPEGLFKVRLIYNGSGIHNLEVVPYTIRRVQSLQLVVGDDIDYTYKWADRSSLNKLTAMKGAADDVLICRNGLITDVSYANIVFYDGRHWFTPEQPLLEGVHRARLLKDGIIQTAPIKINDLRLFQKARLINAMVLWEESPDIDISQIYAILPGK